MSMNDEKMIDISMRDYFAAQAVGGAALETDEVRVIAERAYEIADAMMEAREK